MIKVALNAGHYMGTAGKRCMKSIDSNETREWYLNDRVCDKIEGLLSKYEGYELLRIDDTTGKNDTTLTERTNKANEWGADVYIAIHHNAGANGTKASGIVAFTYTNPKSESVEWQKELYDALIAKTGLKGNRASPLSKANFHEVRETKMPAVLLELGFMDSTIDTPIILTEEFATQCAEAIVSVIVKKGELIKKREPKVIHRVQVGAFLDYKNAKACLDDLKNKGYNGFIVKETEE